LRKLVANESAGWLDGAEGSHGFLPINQEEKNVKRYSMSLLAVVVLVLAACGGGNAATTTTAGATTTTAAAATTTAAEVTTTTAGATVELLIWADEQRTPVVQEVAAAFTEATGVNVTVETKEFGDIRDQMVELGPAGEGADVFIGAHDWTGQLAVSGVAAPIDLGAKASEFEPVSLDAFSYGGSLYAVPYATEAIALYYNTDLVPEPPATWEEIADICAALDGLENCVGIPGGGDGPDAYHNYPFVSAMGGYIFAYDPATGYDPSDVGLDSEGAIAGVTFLQEQVEAGVVGAVNGDTAKALFLEGTEPFFLSGPWQIGDFSAQDAVKWSVAKIPTIAGNTPAPFVGAQGFFLSAFSENTVVAQSFLLDYIATADAQQALYDADPRNPAFTAVLDTLSDDPIAATFAASAATGNPMPNIAEMGAVWAPLGENLQLVRNGELDATAAMTTAAELVRSAVAG
jgi:arabinogalactan oligomer/maltooligosaccharide transport system substrate-binding protein